MSKQSLVICVLVVLAALLGIAQSQEYQANWASLNSRPMPKWYDQAKFVFLPLQIQPIHVHHDFAPMFKPTLFEPTDWAKIFNDSGAKYVVLTTKHHDGWTNWQSAESWGWNSVDVGPNMDLVENVTAAVKAAGLEMGLYYSLFEFYNPLYLADAASGSPPKTDNYVKEVMLPQLYDIVNKYEPSIVWADGEWDQNSTYWESTTFLSWLFSNSTVKDHVVINDRWGAECRGVDGGFWTGGDRYNPGKLIDHKWENCNTIGTAWAYNQDEQLIYFQNSTELIQMLVETVSCGGNLLLDVGPTSEGIIPLIEQERLRNIGEWLGLNGEAIYNSTPWRAQNDTAAGNIWYTTNLESGAVYAMSYVWPSSFTLDLVMPIASHKTKVDLLGYGPVEYKAHREGGMTIKLPYLAIDQYPPHHMLSSSPPLGSFSRDNSSNVLMSGDLFESIGTPNLLFTGELSHFTSSRPSSPITSPADGVYDSYETTLDTLDHSSAPKNTLMPTLSLSSPAASADSSNTTLHHHYKYDNQDNNGQDRPLPLAPSSLTSSPIMPYVSMAPTSPSPFASTSYNLSTLTAISPAASTSSSPSPSPASSLCSSSQSIGAATQIRLQVVSEVYKFTVFTSSLLRIGDLKNKISLEFKGLFGTITNNPLTSNILETTRIQDAHGYDLSFAHTVGELLNDMDTVVAVQPSHPTLFLSIFPTTQSITYDRPNNSNNNMVIDSNNHHQRIELIEDDRSLKNSSSLNSPLTPLPMSPMTSPALTNLCDDSSIATTTTLPVIIATTTTPIPSTSTTSTTSTSSSTSSASRKEGRIQCEPYCELAKPYERDSECPKCHEIRPHPIMPSENTLCIDPKSIKSTLDDSDARLKVSAML
eukprot:gene15138-17917_t